MSKNAEKIAIASKVIAMSDSFQWEQIVRDPTFTKLDGSKSHLDLIFTSLPVSKEATHLKSLRIKHDALQAIMAVPTNNVNDNDNKE